MAESIRYLSIALQTIKLLQTQLIKHLQKSSSVALLEFKKAMDQHLSKVRNIEIQKSIEFDKISTCLSEMDSFLEKTIRMRKTSHSERFNYRGGVTTQGTERMGLSGRTFFQSRSNELAPGGLSEIEEITHSYKIKESPRLTTGMKWRIASPYQGSTELSKEQKKTSRTLEVSSIQVLNQTIPDMEKRIKLLSFNRNSLELNKQSPRTLEQKKRQPKRYIAQLF